MKQYLLIIASLTTVIGSLWLGAYGVHIYENQWQALPALLTSTLVGFSGLGLLVRALVSYIGNES